MSFFRFLGPFLGIFQGNSNILFAYL